MSEIIPSNNKFCCIAFQNAGCETRGSRIQLQDGLSVHTGSPLELAKHWQEWLGTIHSKRLHDSNFAILACAPSLSTGDEHKRLERIAYGFLYALFMQGVPWYEGGLVVSGASIESEIEAHSVGDLKRFYRIPGVQPNYILNQSINTAGTVAKGIRYVFSETGSFERVRRGIHAWIRAIQEREAQNRLHQFVRSVEALVKPEISRTQRQFSHRCQTFVGASDQARRLLWEFYDLRSASEHMNGWEFYLEQVLKSERDREASLRAYQAELLASQVYTKLLSSQALLRVFETDESIEKFWMLQDGERKTLWGDTIDLETLAAAHFQCPAGVPC